MANKGSSNKTYNAIYKEALLTGYFRQTQANNNNIPQKVIATVESYCFSLDEFMDLRRSSAKKRINSKKQYKTLRKAAKNTTIMGPDNTTFHSISKRKQYIIGSRIIPPLSGTHFWKFAVNANNPKCSVAVRLMYDQNNSKNGKHLHLISPSFAMNELPKLSEDPLFIGMYFNSSGPTLIYSVNGIRRSPLKIEKIPNTNYRMIIETKGFDKRSQITVSLLSYQSSELCLRVINNRHNQYTNAELGKAYINYAELSYNLQTKLRYTKLALDVYPKHEIWNSNYISLLIALGQYDEAYEYVMQTGRNNGQLGIANLASHFEDNQHYKKASELYDLLDEHTMTEGCSALIVGICKQKNNEYKAALKLFYKQLDQMSGEEHSGDNEYKTVCQMHIGCVHYQLRDFRFCLKALLSVDDRNPKDAFKYFANQLSHDYNTKADFNSFLIRQASVHSKDAPHLLFEMENPAIYNNKLQMLINVMRHSGA